jgi:hypothetical protein
MAKNTTPKNIEYQTAEGKYLLITDANVLNNAVSQTLSLYDTVIHRLHVVAVSAIFNAVMEDGGNPDVLNRFFRGLRTNDQTALRNYVRRMHMAIGFGLNYVPNGRTQDEYKAAAEHGAVFTFSNGNREKGTAAGFKIIRKADLPHVMDNRKAAERLCVEFLINPELRDDPDDEEKTIGWTRFMDRNNLAELKRFGDADVVKAIKSINSRLASESVEVTASPEMQAFVARIAREAEELMPDEKGNAGILTQRAREQYLAREKEKAAAAKVDNAAAAH